MAVTPRPTALALAVLAPLATAAGPAAGPATGQTASTTAPAVPAAGPSMERLVFPARPGVCGAGDGILVRSPDGTSLWMSGRDGGRRSDGEAWEESDPPCEEGVVVVEWEGEWEWERERGSARSVGVAVMAPSRLDPAGGVVVAGDAAARRLLAEAVAAGAAGHDRAAGRLIFAATLAADVVLWPELLELARDRALPEGLRRHALRWLGHAASERALAGVDGIVRDRSESRRVREAAVFALARLPQDRAVPTLIDVVRTLDDPGLRARALFWLAGFDDPRAVALFEEILAGPAPGRR